VVIQWRDIPGYEGLYQASSAGDIRSLSRIVKYKDGRETLHPGRVLRPGKCSRGYRRVNLCKGKAKKTWLVSRLVLLTFSGVCPEGLEVCHNNNDPGNNTLNNLRYDTHQSNIDDKMTFGTDGFGEKNSVAKLTECKVNEIKQKYSRGEVTQRQLAVEYCVSRPHISDIVNNKRWGHLSKVCNQRARKRLTIDQVRVIRRKYNGGMTQTELARKFSITNSQVSRIVNHKSWRNI